MADRYRLVHGDCLPRLADEPPESADMLITDPPYSSGGAFRADRVAGGSSAGKFNGLHTRCQDFDGDSRDQRSWAYWCTLWLGQCHRVLRRGSLAFVFTDWRQLAALTDAFQAGGFVFRGVAVWDKTTQARPQRGRLKAQAEFVVWGSKGPHTPGPDAPCLPGVFCARVREPRVHVAQKPVAGLLAELVTLAPPGGVILDPFAGSCSTGEAALRTGRRFLGFESDEAWLVRGRDRLDALVVDEAPVEGKHPASESPLAVLWRLASQEVAHWAGDLPYPPDSRTAKVAALCRVLASLSSRRKRGEPFRLDERNLAAAMGAESKNPACDALKALQVDQFIRCTERGRRGRASRFVLCTPFRPPDRHP